MTAYEKLTKKYELEASLAELEFRKQELEALLPERKAQKRESDLAAAAEYGGLQRFLDRLRGRGEESREQRLMAARTAAGALEAAQRDLAVVSQKCDEVLRQWEALGDKETLFYELNEEDRAYFLRMEASLWAERALHYLRKCRKELAAAQELGRNPMMNANDGYQENVHKQQAGKLADQCRNSLEKIHNCGFVFPMHPYLENPMGYIASAMRHGDLDRMNSAQSGIREMETLLKELLLQLAQ